MKTDRQLIVHFNNGSTLNICFPEQIRNSAAALLEGLKRIMEADKFTIEADGKLIVIPWSSVQQL